jgi:hypothetical protein
VRPIGDTRLWRIGTISHATLVAREESVWHPDCSGPGMNTHPIEQWIRRTSADERDHCHGVRRDVALPGSPPLDFVSFRHRAPAAPGAPDVFSVSLWRCLAGAVTSGTVRDMGLSLLLWRASYAQLLEDAACRGWQRRHRFTVQGNILGSRVERNTLLDTLSVGGGEVVFWTFSEESGQLVVEPYYADDPGEQEGRVEEILDHLTWDKPPAPVASAASR